jgi:phosphoribosylformylglycinamidine synthase
MLGILDDVRCATTAHFKTAGDEIALLGTNLEEIGGSEYLKAIHGQVTGDCPALDLEREKAVQSACIEMIRRRLLSSAHDIADGGLAVALAECCIMNEERPLGAQITLPEFKRADFALFSESQSLVVISYSPAQRNQIEVICAKHRAPFSVVGRVEGETLKISSLLEVTLPALRQRYWGAIEKKMEWM